MRRRAIVGLVALAGLAGTALVGWRRSGARDAAQSRQWPFDRTELAALMDRIIADQRERVAALPAGPARDRAAAFLAYYQGRRAVVS